MNQPYFLAWNASLFGFHFNKTPLFDPSFQAHGLNRAGQTIDKTMGNAPNLDRNTSEASIARLKFTVTID